MRMKRIIFTKQKSIVTFQMADELSRQQTNSNKHEKRKGLTKRIASSSFSMSKNSRISKESGCCCAIKVCVYIFHNFYISIVFICYSFLFATRFYLLPFGFFFLLSVFICYPLPYPSVALDKLLRSSPRFGLRPSRLNSLQFCPSQVGIWAKVAGSFKPIGR